MILIIFVLGLYFLNLKGYYSFVVDFGGAGDGPPDPNRGAQGKAEPEKEK
jgi:hypothetical protein